MMTLIKLCAYLTSFFILVWFLKFILTLFQVVLIKLHKEDVPKDMLRWLNPFMLPAIIMEKENYKKSTFVIVYVIYIIGIAGLTLEGIKYTDLGSTTIGSYIEKREYTEYYYVNMFPDGSEDTNYRNKAKIIATLEDRYDGSDEYTERAYYIEKAYLSNGEIIEFENTIGGYSLELGKKVSIYDDEDNYWKVELTDMKAD